MADNLPPQFGQSEDPLCKAREILNGLPVLRWPLELIRMTETEPRAKGGQATITIGTVTPLEEPITWITPQILATFGLIGLKLIQTFPTEGLKNTLEGKLAIKKFSWDRDDVRQSAKFFKSFVNELSVMATLSHPNVVDILGFVEDMENGDAWIVLRWEPNGNVREFLKSGEWDIPERISLIQDVVNGVEYLHSRDPPICHGDLKSLNILVNSSYHAVITDFGSARIQPRVDTAVNGSVSEVPNPAPNNGITEGLTSPKVKLNAPEVLDDGVQDMPSDMWAVGWICWEIVTGKFPFEELHTVGPIISRVLNGELPAIRVDAQLSQIGMLCGLMSDCWILEPAKRIAASTFRRKVCFMPATAPSETTTGDVKVRSAALLLSLGKTYTSQKDTRMAVSHYQSAADLAFRTGDLGVEGEALVELGEAYSHDNKVREAEELWGKAYRIFSRTGNEHGMGEVLNSLGRIHFRRSRNEEAEKAFREAHKIHSRIGNDLGAAMALDGLGGIYLARSEFQEAEKAFKEAHEIQSLVGNDIGAVNTLTNLGDLYFAQSRYQEAEKVLMEAHQISSHIGYDMGVVNRLQKLGAIYSVWSRYQEAEKSFREAHELGSATGDESRLANGLLNLGQIYHIRGKFSDAEKFLGQAYAIYSRSGGDERGVQRALLGLGDLYRVQSRYQEAEKTLREAHEISSRIGDEGGAASALTHLGDLYCAQSRYGEAEKALREAYEIHSRIDFSDMELAATLNHLGMLYSNQSRYQEAENALREAYEISSRIGDEHGEADALLLLGEIDRSHLRYQEAEKAFKTAYDIYSRLDHSISIGMVLRSLGMLRHAQCRYDEMETFYSKAISIDPRADSGNIRAGMLLQLGNAQLAQHKFAEAEEALTESLAILMSIAHDEPQAFISTLILICQSKNPEWVDLLFRAQATGFAAGDLRHAVSLHAEGDYYVAQGMYAKAEECYRLAQAIYLSVGNARGEATELLSLGHLYIRHDRYGEAEELLVQARAAFASCVDDSEAGDVQALDGLMTLYVMQGKFGDAKVACVEACQIYTRTGWAMSDTCATTWQLVQDLEERPDMKASVQVVFK